ncbi:tetratricopeptide repeat protein [Massilia sp. YIM B02763]|uniref:tetratricopeptide repeat protein n=1 Tax=Massilia sp. YIM B02763 TaxID=3050130 RepID=UPI0025B67CF7|nr:tetratricopeptide repeat protein [Massilia sp. YIM B02763]MDN4055249.1 tetratricopeptide repeat protein [Massilia sp. YIM B02763]
MKRLLSLALCLLLAACASVAPPPSPAPLFADAAFAPPSEPVGTADLFALSPAMRAYLHSPAFAAHLREKGPKQGLLDALYSKSDLKLEYDARTTRTAAGTYAARAGNCLSLVIMTAAFARELGMDVQFRSVTAEGTWTREGGLYLLSSHVNIALGRRAVPGRYDADALHQLVVDFLPPPQAAHLRVRELDEGEIAALFLNNRAVETLVQDRIDDAYWWARAAVAANPRDITAYNTLGVVYQRHGDLAMAERAWRAALARAPENLALLQNLAPLLAQQGRMAEARDIERRVARIEPVPPFHYFDQGLAALKEGDNDKARQLFERELKRAPYSDEFHFWLAVALLRLGDARQAREHLVLAVEHSARGDMRDVYSAKLAHLRRQGANGLNLH